MLMDILPASSARIERIGTALVTTDMQRDFKVSHGVDPRYREHLLVQVTDEDGAVGFGEASPLTFFTGETAESARGAVDHYFAPLVVGTDPVQLTGLHRAWNGAYPGHGAAKCAIDSAIHDLLARRQGRPVSDLLGGRVHDRIPLYKAIGFGGPDDVVADGERLWELGIRSFKVKVGEGRARDLAKLEALRTRFGTEVEIVVDGNGGYRPHDAVRFLREAVTFDVAYVEQPVPEDDLEGLAFVRSHGGVPVMADESVHTLRDAHRLIASGAVDLIGIKLIKTGGLMPARHIADLAEACGVGCVLISPFDTELGVAAAAQLAATFPAPVAAQGLATFMVVDDQTDRTLEVENGSLVIPQGVGFGVAPDPVVFTERRHSTDRSSVGISGVSSSVS